MAEVFTNSLSRAAGIVTTNSSGSVGVTTNLITGISTVGLAVGYLVDNQNFLKGTKVGVNQAIVDRDSTNTASASSQSINFLGLTSSYTSPAATKSILVGGTFSNNTNNSVNLTVEIHDSSSNTAVGLAQKIPVPAGSSFVISDTGKTLLEANDSVRVYCDSANAIDVSLSVLQGVS